MQSVMKHSFAKIPAPTMPRSSFDRSHGHKTTMDADFLYPIFIDEALPGDTMKLTPQMFARMATPIYPLMDNLHIDTFWFAVPYRILWSNWHKFLGAQDDPGDSIDYTIPTTTSPASTGYTVGSLHDYLGIPPGIPNFEHSALPLRGYLTIWNEWFKDQNLQDSKNVSKGDGPDTSFDWQVYRRGKRHDYFTSCLPYPQKSDTQTTMPLGDTAPVRGTGADTYMHNSDGDYVIRAPIGTATDLYATGPGATGTIRRMDKAALDGSTGLEVDLSSATSATINAIRLAVTTQQFLERDARGGTRINEIILSHFGVVSPDGRVQRPEYLGGSTDPVSINTVPQTSETGTTPQGTLSAFGTFSAQTGGFTKSFTEHCLIIGIANVRADLTYQKGVDKLWTRSTRFDFYWPEFANIGEQAVLQQEIEVTGVPATDEAVFGYQERFAEYRMKNSRLSGLMRSDAAGSLDPWHLSQELSSPALNDLFIRSTTPMARVEAVPSEPDFIVDMYFNYQCIRPMPTYGTPGLARF